MGKVCPSRCTRTSTFGPVRSKAAVSARRIAETATTKHITKMNTRIRERWRKSINKEFFISKPLHFTTGSHESRPGRREKSQMRNLAVEAIIWKRIFMVLRLDSQEQSIRSTMVQSLARTSRRRVDNISKNKTADIRMRCERR